MIIAVNACCHLQISVLIAQRSSLETLEPFNVRLKEHSNTTRWTLSAVGEHLRETGHSVEERKADVITREENNFRRKTCEALKILC